MAMVKLVLLLCSLGSYGCEKKSGGQTPEVRPATEGGKPTVPDIKAEAPAVATEKDVMTIQPVGAPIEVKVPSKSVPVIPVGKPKLAVTAPKAIAPSVETKEEAPKKKAGRTGKKSVQKDSYVVSVVATESGGKGTLTVELKPSGIYKLNQEFPTKMILSASSATLAKSTIKKSEAQEFGEKKGIFKTTFSDAKAGATFTCKARFAVCTDDECVPKTQEVAVTLK